MNERKSSSLIFCLDNIVYDDLVLLAKVEKLLQDMIDKPIETGRCYRMEMNVEETKVMRISIQPFPVKIMVDQKNLIMRNLLNIWVAF